MAKTGEGKAGRKGQSAREGSKDSDATQTAGLSHVSLLQVSLYSGKSAHNSMRTTADVQVSFKPMHKSGESLVVPSPVVREGSVFESKESRP
jgi:hypothetical protein